MSIPRWIKLLNRKMPGHTGGDTARAEKLYVNGVSARFRPFPQSDQRRMHPLMICIFGKNDLLNGFPLFKVFGGKACSNKPCRLSRIGNDLAPGIRSLG